MAPKTFPELNDESSTGSSIPESNRKKWSSSFRPSTWTGRWSCSWTSSTTSCTSSTKLVKPVFDGGIFDWKSSSSKITMTDSSNHSSTTLLEDFSWLRLVKIVSYRYRTKLNKLVLIFMYYLRFWCICHGYFRWKWNSVNVSMRQCVNRWLFWKSHILFLSRFNCFLSLDLYIRLRKILWSHS